MKTCCTCKATKPFDLFPRNKSEKDGYKKRCKDCNNRANREYRERHPEAAAASSRNWAARNPGRVEAKKQRWLARNPGRMTELMAKWRAENPDRAYETNKRHVSRPHVRLHRAIGSRLRKMLENKRESTFALLGYSRSELVAHIEKQFTRGMTWENFGEWHLDHITPLSSFVVSDENDPLLKAAWCLSNLRPLWAQENMEKSNKRLFLL